MTIPRVPTSTYRLQFNGEFTFEHARGIVDYIHALGISDCYASSYLKAVAGSPHGYDVADPTCLNPDVGTEAEYWAWIEAMRSRGMGHVLDVVPNHMGIAKSANRWWLDVLENGPSSRFARFFDIEWRPVKDELADKVLIPILGDQYGSVLERQELKLALQDGAFVIRYYDDLLPIAPDTYGRILGSGPVELVRWISDHPGEAADELQIVLAATGNLPPRSTRDPDLIALRSREKEVIKRRLAALAASSPEARLFIDACIARMNGVAGRPRTFDPLDQLLNEQSYRLAHWRVASEEINYRRFFDVNQLAAVRMEDPEVFDEVHRFVLELVRRGGPTGLRIDHVDGLYAPEEYLQRLQANLTNAGGRFYIVVEKILGAGERLPNEWPVQGTTGYEFSAIVNNLFVDRRNESTFDRIYTRFVRERRERSSFADLAYRSKKQVMHETMSGDINSLGHQLNRFSERNRHFRDFTLYSLISTIKEVIACFPVYRTYVTPNHPVSEHDRRYIVQAVECAKSRAPGVTSLVFDFIQRLLLQETVVDTTEGCDESARFVGKFQQITSPVAAKGIEDTALYVYNRLLSLNEVGSDPTQFGLHSAAVHDWFVERHRDWPSALSSTSTHDSKRGEDVRARINVLSEIPGAWKAAVTKWRTVNRRLKVNVNGTLAPDANEEYFLYQTLVGAWPFDANDGEGLARVRERIASYMTKAMREAKIHTSWLSPNDEYEKAVERFVDAIVDRRRSQFLTSFLPFQARVAELGIYNSLSQLTIKMTAPGVPDFYQGTEFWDLHLVDPDNRRPVDYDRRRDVLAALNACATPAGECAEQLLAHRADGRIKLFATMRGLAARKEWRDIYEHGDYVPLQATGARRECLFAFARTRQEHTHLSDSSFAITCVPRLVATLVPDAAQPLGPTVWTDTRIEMPPSLPTGMRLRNVFTGAIVEPELCDGKLTIAAATLFERFPVAILVPADQPAPPAPPAQD